MLALKGEGEKKRMEGNPMDKRGHNAKGISGRGGKRISRSSGKMERRPVRHRSCETIASF